VWRGADINASLDKLYFHAVRLEQQEQLEFGERKQI
jgi:hypothetical protein